MSQAEQPSSAPGPEIESAVRSWWRNPWVLVGAAALVLLAIWAVAGRSYNPLPRADTGTDQHEDETWNEELLPIAMDKFGRLEEFIESEMLNQAIDQLDQWVQGQKPLEDWQLDSMVASEPRLVSALPQLREAGALAFTRQDILPIREAVLLRDLSNWARGEQMEDVERAKRLFDWTVRNIALSPATLQTAAGPVPILQSPWETLTLGHGGALDRAWVFILLCRQQGLDACLLAVYDDADLTGRQVIPWAVGVLIEKQIHVFSTDLGMPIPTPASTKPLPGGRLDLQPATLAQAAADPAVLDQLDITAEHPYPVKSKNVRKVVALIEASPAYLAQRMRLIETRLSGKDKVVLTTSPTAQVQRLKQCPQIAEVRLWSVPFDLIAQDSQYVREKAAWRTVTHMPLVGMNMNMNLFRGRILYLKGKFSGEGSAAEAYQLARPAERQLDVAGLTPAAELLHERAKISASLWLGLLAVEQENPRAAIDYFAKRTVEALRGSFLNLLANSNLPPMELVAVQMERDAWAHAARYNLARIYEATGETQKAIAEYESDLRAAGLMGNVLRARWLGSKTVNSLKKPAPKSGEATPKTPADRPAPTAKPTDPDKPKQPGQAAASSAQRAEPAKSPKPANSKTSMKP